MVDKANKHQFVTNHLLFAMIVSAVDPRVPDPELIVKGVDMVDKLLSNNLGSPEDRIHIPECDWCEMGTLEDKRS